MSVDWRTCSLASPYVTVHSWNWRWPAGKVHRSQLPEYNTSPAGLGSADSVPSLARGGLLNAAGIGSIAVPSRIDGRPLSSSKPTPLTQRHRGAETQSK